MIVPSATNMKFKFPEFVNVEDKTVEFAVEEAVVACGTGEWVDDSNQTLGIMYYAAHIMKLALLRLEGGQVIQSQSTPEFSVTYAVPQQPSMDRPNDLSTTPYGVRFRELARKNFPAVLVAGSAVAM